MEGGCLGWERVCVTKGCPANQATPPGRGNFSYRRSSENVLKRLRARQGNPCSRDPLSTSRGTGSFFLLLPCDLV